MLFLNSVNLKPRGFMVFSFFNVVVGDCCLHAVIIITYLFIFLLADRHTFIRYESVSTLVYYSVSVSVCVLFIFHV